MSPGAKVTVLHRGIAKTLAEGPVWLEDSNEFAFIDMFESKAIRVDATTNQVREITIPNKPCLCLAHPTTKKDRFMGLCGHEVVAFDWDNPSGVTVLATVDEGKDTRLNDGTADRSGRFWCDSMGNEAVPGVVPEGLGSLYVMEIDREGKSGPIKTANTKPVDLGNGIDWSVDNSTMFFIDSPKLTVYAFDYDPTTGDLSNQQVAINFANCGAKDAKIGVPDGCTMDADNKLWVACYFGGCVCHFDVETGQLIERIVLDTQCPTSCIFGGPHLNQLFVTSANRGYENGGSIYRIDGLNTRGMLTNRANAPKI